MTNSEQSSSIITKPKVIGVVLAGGQSSRMQIDKATLQINGVTNLERAINTLNACQLSDVVISSNNQQDTHIADRYRNGGPLSGIFSVMLELELLKEPTALLVIPVDMPLLTPALLDELIKHGLKNNTACCYQSYNLPIYIPVTKALLTFLKAEFSSERFTKFNKGPSFKHLLKQISCQFLTPPNLDLLANANTPQQWHNICHLINH